MVNPLIVNLRRNIEPMLRCLIHLQLNRCPLQENNWSFLARKHSHSQLLLARAVLLSKVIIPLLSYLSVFHHNHGLLFWGVGSCDWSVENVYLILPIFYPKISGWWFLHKILSSSSVCLSSTMLLKNVVFVPALHCNLLSISMLTRETNFSTIFSSASCVFQDLASGMTIGSADCCTGLYLLQLKPFLASQNLGAPCLFGHIR